MGNPAPYILFASIVLVLLGLIIFKRREESAVYDDTNPNGLPSYCGARPRTAVAGQAVRVGVVIHSALLAALEDDETEKHEHYGREEDVRGWVAHQAPAARSRGDGSSGVRLAQQAGGGTSSGRARPTAGWRPPRAGSQARRGAQPRVTVANCAYCPSVCFHPQTRTSPLRAAGCCASRLPCWR